MRLAIVYTIIALIATAANLGAQELTVRAWHRAFQIELSVFIGTGVGLVVKYALDKIFIFRFRAASTLHAATVGGLGLTGLIVEAELQLRPVPGPWLDAETIAYSGLDEFFRLSEESHPAWEHAVSWIDCTDDAVRGLFMRAKPAAGEHGTWRERRLAMPPVPPVSLVNRLTLKPFNQLIGR
jgi:hypothetical protein